MGIKKIIKKIVFKEKCDSITYIKHLRKIGMDIGNNVNIYAPRETIIDETRPFLIKIGSNVNITSGVKILTHGYDWSVLKAKTGRVYGSAGKVKIGNNVFIGMNSIILKGVTIGDNVIIGAGSVVTKDIKENSVVAGNPAKYICDIDEYEKKRQVRQLEEAYEMFESYYARYNKEPNIDIFDEFFFLFGNKECMIFEKAKKQLENTGNYETSIYTYLNHNPMFENYKAFKEYCLKRMEKNRHNKKIINNEI